MDIKLQLRTEVGVPWENGGLAQYLIQKKKKKKTKKKTKDKNEQPKRKEEGYKGEAKL